MKNFSLTRIAAALAVGLLGAGAASADVIVTGASALSTNNSAVYLGTYNPNTDDNGTYTHAGLGGSGNISVGAPFSDWWVFTINPAGLAAINANFILTGNISNFALDLYSLPDTASTYGCGAAPSACTTASAVTSLTTASSQFLSGPNTTVLNYQVNMPSMFLEAGTYAFHISGLSYAVADRNPNSYSGNISVSVPVPEPGSLALVAAGLLAAGAVARRRAK